MQTAIRIRRYWSAWLFGAVLLPSAVLANTALVPSPPSSETRLTMLQGNGGKGKGKGMGKNVHTRWAPREPGSWAYLKNFRKALCFQLGRC